MVKLTDVFEDGSDLVPENFDGDKRIIKVMLPGEGIWAYINNPEDIEKYDNGDPSDSFEVILLNQPFMHDAVLRWGFVVKVNCDGRDNRPVVDLNWLRAQADKLDALVALEEQA